ncbi:hydrolase [Paractinoplanes abujensis]|uniref:Putative CocE/NonD family hydrolase n=1 Tax=Paractinoplanes abujensis TaxID=882441 RepID=A0A7W7G5Y9_9ACTN|nr:CocE/NonD family hydrolase [Actinoplanes abujensis]MBB4697044.1 putative CocE/NonD family hydrolase [Actinoplanes abujensis]GID18484.1 hydrolase [Actinoplanes abujensis]
MANSIRQRLADAALSRLLRQGPAANDYVLATARTPMRDGVVLVGDHYAPVTARPRGTVLMRSPYGRGFPASALNGRLFAARGYHVIIQSVRGTFGSGGRFVPMAQEAEDGLDTVAWLREQPWFDGRLATLGASYLAWSQWAMMQDPPPELRAAVVYVGPHDFREAVYGTGAFTLGDFLGWSDLIAHQEDGGLLRRALNDASARRRLRPALEGLPLAEAADPVLRGRAPWYREWLAHPDGDDPWWQPYRAGAALDRVDTPVLIISGWQDLFVDQSLRQYEALRARNVEVGLTVGPWTHLTVGLQGAMTMARESLAWLDQHMAEGPAARKSPVRVFRTGERRWHELASWPPPSAPAIFQLHADRTLTLAAGPARGGDPSRPDALDGSVVSAGEATGETVRFRYDPADPTPTVGGRTLTGSMGVKDNRALEARADVLTFTTDPLPTAVDVIGAPVLELAVSVEPEHADVFVRLCDVDKRGHSRNFADGMRRLDPSVPAGRTQRLTLTLDPCFHRLAAGHRLRVQVSGGSFPRFARNVGSAADAHELRPRDHTVHCAQSRLVLPVAAPN